MDVIHARPVVPPGPADETVERLAIGRETAPDRAIRTEGPAPEAVARWP